MSMFGRFFASASSGQGLGIPSSGVSPHSPGGTGPHGVVVMDSRAANKEAGIPYVHMPVFPPTVAEALDGNIHYAPRFRTAVFGGEGTAAGVIQTQAVPFSCPTVVVARSGAAIDASDADLPIGRDSLDTFKVQMFTTGQLQDLLDAGAGGATSTSPTVLVLGSALLGPAALPGLIPKNGRFFDNGYFLNITVQVLIANIEVHVTLWCVEEIGPARIS
jgi:hypothetical protein